VLAEFGATRPNIAEVEIFLTDPQEHFEKIKLQYLVLACQTPNTLNGSVPVEWFLKLRR